MFFKHKKETQAIPKECIGLEIKIESSICTGEKTIGFLSKGQQEPPTS